MPRIKSPEQKEPGTKKISRPQVQEKYYSDLDGKFKEIEKDELFALIIRSTVSKGRIKSITHKKFPPGYFLYTARDIPGSRYMETDFGKVPIFCEGQIAYLGEPIGILVGPDENVLNKLSASINIILDYTTTDAYLNDLAKEEKIPVQVKKTNNQDLEKISRQLMESDDDFFKSIFTNQNYSDIISSESEQNESENTFNSEIIVKRVVEKGPCFNKDKKGRVAGIESALKKSYYVLENGWTYKLNTPAFREPAGAICQYKNEILTIYAPSLWISNLRQTLADTLSIKPENIQINRTRSQNKGSNSVWYSTIITCQVALAALLTGKYVKLVYSPAEQERFMDTMLPITIIHKTGADVTGKITAMQILIEVDAGAYNPFAKEIVDRLAIASYGCYSAQNLRISSMAFTSSNPPSSIDLRLLDSAAFFAMENQISELGRVLNKTPVEIRKINFAEADKKSTHHPFIFTISDPWEVIDRLAYQSDFIRKYSAYYVNNLVSQSRGENLLHASGTTVPLRGIGLACAFEGSCYYGSQMFRDSDQSLEITWEKEDCLVIHSPITSTSIKNLWKKQASEILGISEDSVKIDSEFSNEKEPLIPDTFYSNISVMMELLTKCCELLKRKKGKSKFPITVKKSITAMQKKVWNPQKFEGRPFHGCSFGAATIEIEMDPCTFREHIREMYVVIKGGKILNEQSAKSSIRLAIHRILASLVDNDVVELEDVHIDFEDTNETPSQIGELINQMVPAAYCQAISQALGHPLKELTLKTDSLYKMLCDKQMIQEAIEKKKKEMQKAAEENAKSEAAKAETKKNGTEEGNK
ncbi:MAG TPA: hypothetical protein DEO40_03260 [Treponema sp.]|jgi:CO/xanthine dehydrogenase Mo-binding subunit|nr:hypothetical protein [Treponema sp.]HCA19677.1 hypothetical protein [Treponema sp.]